MINEAEVRAEIVQKYHPWRNLDPAAIALQRMTGITNAIFKAHVPGHPQSIVYRKFGDSHKNPLLCREVEAVICEQLAAKGCGPKIYYYDQSIRLEEFIDSTILTTKNMLLPGYLEQVAYALSHLHSIKPSAPQIPKLNLIRQSFLKARQKVLALCQSKLAQQIYSQDEQQIVQQFKKWVTQDELAFIEQVIRKYEVEGEVVFCHNDLSGSNVLVGKQDGRLSFIDFEYAHYNFAFYDIANYFEQSRISYECEEPPFFRLLQPDPSAETNQLRFLDAYVVARRVGLLQFRQQFEQLRNSAECVQEREKLQKALGVGRLLCNFVWTVWAIIVSKNPDINFDYLRYAEWRYHNYLKQKQALSDL